MSAEHHLLALKYSVSPYHRRSESAALREDLRAWRVRYGIFTEFCIWEIQLAEMLHDWSRILEVMEAATGHVTDASGLRWAKVLALYKSKRRNELQAEQEYADRLAIHVNSLNRAVKEVTGKLTTVHIAERLINEAKVLLQYQDWSVSEIADSLGVDYPTYFHRFFKKHTGTTPLAFRHAV